MYQNLKLRTCFIRSQVHPLRFYDKRDAEDAMDALDGRMYDGRDLRIQMAKYGRPEPSER